MRDLGTASTLFESKPKIFDGVIKDGEVGKRWSTAQCILQGVNEDDISELDQPSNYPPLRRQEKIIIGTFIDSAIVPGFKYTVRVNGTTEMFFAGKPKYLESIGQGYGRRLTFESDDILNNDNYFWSDSSRSGFAFAINVLEEGEKFQVWENNKLIGHCTVKTVSEEQEIIRSENDLTRKEHVKDVQVNFSCCFQLNGFSTESFSEVSGIVTTAKHQNETRGCIKHIIALLLPSGTALLLKPMQ